MGNARNRRRGRWKHRCLLLTCLMTPVCLPSPWLCRLDGQDSFAEELPRIPVTEASETLEHFTIADGFEIQLVAAEPLIASPVAIEWDATGAMYVCEMRGYSENRDDRLSQVRRLIDTDGDGVYDQANVFVEGLFWPTAILPYDGGLFIGDAPDLLHCKDTDGDGVADVKKVVLTGFGTSNVQGLLNSFRWGLDNRIHVACSSVGGKIHRPGEPENAVDVRGRDLAFDPRTFEIELTSGGAQHGMCFDDWGRKFVSSNSDHIQQILYEDRYVARNRSFSAPSARVSIAADGPQAEVYRTSPVEPWRIVRTRLRVGGLVPGPIEGGGRAAGYFTGATGVTIYRGDAWPQQWKGLALIGDVGSNLIHRKQLKRLPNELQETAYRIDKESEFVASSDIWFRPAQFANAPDGNLFVVDVCREVIEHPKSLPEDIKRHLDLTSGRDRGRVYRIAAEGTPVRHMPTLEETETTELVELLQHPNAWHRETAARLLFERQDPKAMESLRALAAGSTLAQGRLQAMYVAHGLGALNANMILERLNDDSPQVRRHAIRLSESLPSDAELNRKLSLMVEDPSLEVRYQLAFSIGSLDHLNRIELLTQLIRRDVDSRWMRLAVQSSLATGAGEVFADLAANGEFRSETAATFLSDLAAQIRTQADPIQTAAALRAVVPLADSDPLFTLPIASQLLGPSGQRINGRAAEGVPALEATVSEVVASLLRSASDIASDREWESHDRARAVEALSLGRWEDVASTLVALIDNREPIEIQRAAIETAGKFSSPQVARPLLSCWKNLSPSLRQTAGEVLFARPEWTLQLFDAVDQGDFPDTDLPRARLTIAANSSNAKVKSRALQYLSSTVAPARLEVFAAYQPALTQQGSLERGRALFAKHCAGCHRVEGRGHEIGPNLATMKTRGAETILTNVLDPNAEVNPQYLNYVLLTVDGRTMTGMITSENANSVTLKRAEGATDTVLRSDIDLLQSTGKSIMPEGMEASIDLQGMTDLIGYLMQVQ